MIDKRFINEYKENIVTLWIRKWFTSLFYFRLYRKLHPDRPWYMPKANRFLDSKMPNIHRVFEYGSGDSSLWFSNRVKEYIAVEHDQVWYSKVTQLLAAKNLTNAKIHFVPDDNDDLNYDWQNNWQYYNLLKHAPDGPKYRNYMASIDQYPDRYFDCIVIDGRARVGCLLHSRSKLSENGIIILDDSARYYYQEAFTLMSDWHHISFRYGLGQTTFFARNKEILNW